MYISRSIFIEDGTTVEFTRSGKFTVGNFFIPAFVIADSHDIALTVWNVEDDAGRPHDRNTGGYANNGDFVPGPKPGSAINDLRLTRWLADNRRIVFDRRAGNVSSEWTGTTNACAVFLLTGESSNLRVTGMNLHVPQSAGVDRFIPVGDSLAINFKGNQTVVAKPARSSEYFAVPHDLSFTDIAMDGTYPGWIGSIENALFEQIHSKRYGDLQVANRGKRGGLNKCFTPRHRFCFSHSVDGDPGLFNRNVRITDVTADGVRPGQAHNARGAGSVSEYASSLKLGCVDCRVDNYRSSCPDGFMDVLPSYGLAVADVTAAYDSSFLNNLFPGWLFSSATYKNVRFENITFIDTAPASVQRPVGNANRPNNHGIEFKNVHIEFSHRAGQGSLPLPTITGQSTDVTIDYEIKGDATWIVRARKEALEVTLRATPDRPPPGTPMALTWNARESQNCNADGTWSGDVGVSGSRSVTLPHEEVRF